VVGGKSVNFADLYNPQKSMNMRYDTALRTKLGRDDSVEISLVEPQNENYSWQVGDLSSCGYDIYEEKSDWGFIFSKNKN